MPKLKQSSFRNLKKLLKSKSPMSLLKEISSLFAYIELFDVLFVLVLIFALAKDISDMFISLIPIIGLALSLFISAFCAIFIFLIMFLLGAGANKKIAQRLVIIFIGTFADTVPFVSFLPIETIVVIICFALVLQERKEKSQEEKQKTRKKQVATQQIYAPAQFN